MIFGIGTDIVQIERMRQNLERYGDKFAKRLLADSEIEEFKNHVDPARLVAKRFAAKEAASKAMGTGFRNGITFKQIFVSHNELGKPILNFTDVAATFMKDNSICESHISLSDEQEYAVAYVTLEIV